MPGDRRPVEPVIRPVHVSDAEAVYAIRRQPAVMRFTTAMPEDTLERTSRFLGSFGPDDRVVVAEAGGRIVGMAVQLLTLVRDQAGELHDVPHAEWSVRLVWN